MAATSRTPSLTPSRSPTPEPPIVQPDHFYGSEGIQFPPSPKSVGKTWLDPADDPAATRGIPVFKPTMEQFQDFEGYMEKINCWGQRSGIVKVIPPKEWKESLPSIKPQLAEVKIKTPIEQHMLGSGGLFRQQNMEKRKIMSVREWVELCSREEYRAPAVDEVGLESRGTNARVAQPRNRKEKKKEEEAKADEDEVLSPPNSERAPSPRPTAQKPRRVAQSREVRQANLAERAARDLEFLETFDADADWLPRNTKASDYTPEFCQKLERRYWRNCGLGKPAWYGADTQGTLYTDETKIWNVGHLPSALDRLLPASEKGLPGVNTPYLYFGMWRATFAWHVEDMDLYSINYIHFGAPKFWYAVPQAKATALEHAMRTYFPKDTSQCHQFLRHKSFLVSPTTLAKSSCRPNHLVQHAGEFVITYPRGYHAGFNLGMNCAESVNFALECWIELGRNAKVCQCVPDSVRIDVDQLLKDREAEAAGIYEEEEEEEGSEAEAQPIPTSKLKRKRSHKKKPTVPSEPKGTIPPLKIPSLKRPTEEPSDAPKLKKIKLKAFPKESVPLIPMAPSSTFTLPPLFPKSSLPKISLTLKIGPRPADAEPYPCCLCVSMSKAGLVPVHNPPVGKSYAVDAANNPKVWMAHELCASIIPETWVDEFDDGRGTSQRMVYGVDAIVKDRWNLKCSACTRARPKAHGAPVQCTKGKCPKAFHVTCAQDVQAHGTSFTIVRDVEKEVVILAPPLATGPGSMQVDANPDNPSPNANGQVIKVIKKLEVHILCSQHNPAVAAQKKLAKQEKIRQDLLALPEMSRIKIRVSSGVFEVTLLRVIEETGSVEVLWDGATKREFKWGSVVFGSTDSIVLQRPSDASAPPVQSLSSSVSVAESARSLAGTAPICPPIAPTTSSSSSTLSSTAPPPCQSAVPLPVSNTTPHPTTSYVTYAQLQQRMGPYEYWPYGTTAHQPQPQPQQQTHQTVQMQMSYAYPQGTYAYPYSGYYSGATSYPQAATVTVGTYGVYPYAQAGYRPVVGATPQYRNGMLQWQTPYQGPVNPTPSSSSGSAGSQAGQSNEDQNQHASSSAGAQVDAVPVAKEVVVSLSQVPGGQGPLSAHRRNLSSEPRESNGSKLGGEEGLTSGVVGDVAQAGVEAGSEKESSADGVKTSSAAIGGVDLGVGSQVGGVGGGEAPGGRVQPEQSQQTTFDLSSLAKMSSEQLTELLSHDPQLREVVLTALNRNPVVQQQEVSEVPAEGMC